MVASLSAVAGLFCCRSSTSNCWTSLKHLNHLYGPCPSRSLIVQGFKNVLLSHTYDLMFTSCSCCGIMARWILQIIKFTELNWTELNWTDLSACRIFSTSTECTWQNESLPIPPTYLCMLRHEYSHNYYLKISQASWLYYTVMDKEIYIVTNLTVC